MIIGLSQHPPPRPPALRAGGVYHGPHSPVLFRILIIFLCLTAVPFLAAEWDSAEGAVALYTSFEHQMPPLALEAMQEELNWIVSPVGLKFAWRNYLDADKHRPVARLAVVHFKGRCDTEDLTIFPEYAWKLGWAHSVDGRVLPFTDIFCDAIRAYVAPALLAKDPKQRDVMFGRAVGRVLAHELYHVFLETRKHAGSGLAKPSCTREDLVAEQFRLGNNEVRKLRAVLAQSTLLVTSAVAPLAEGRAAFAGNGCVGCHGPLGEGTAKGPTIAGPGIPRDVDALRARLNNPKSEMSRRARDLNLSWPDISKDDLSKILTFLKNTTLAGAAIRSTK